MDNSLTLEERIAAIEERNRRVEAEKQWETSVIRRSLVGAFTYGFMSLFLYLIGVSHPLINALVPTFGFALSTLSLAWVKKRFLEVKNK